MTKQELIEQLISNHQEIINYIDSLNKEEFIISKEGKWTAGQQLQHILLTLLPFPKVLKSKEFIRDKFGEINRPVWDYETVLENYLKTTLKAPEQFLPVNNIDPDQKSQINAEIQKNLESIERLLNDYLENELDTLVLPHPLLGMLTIREMIYLMSYHPLHHLKQVKEALNNQI